PQVGAVRRQQFGGRGRRRCTHVGDEVADRDIGFVAHGADNGGVARGDSASQCLFVKAPEVFERTAAARQNQRIEALAVGQVQGAEGGAPAREPSGQSRRGGRAGAGVGRGGAVGRGRPGGGRGAGEGRGPAAGARGGGERGDREPAPRERAQPPPHT